MDVEKIKTSKTLHTFCNICSSRVEQVDVHIEQVIDNTGAGYIIKSVFYCEACNELTQVVTPVDKVYRQTYEIRRSIAFVARADIAETKWVPYY